MKMGIWIDSDYLRGLAELEDKIVQFLRGKVWVAGRLGKPNLCNF